MLNGLKARWAAARERRPALDHAARAWTRFSDDQGNRLAAAVTYFGFLSFFPLISLVFFVLGFTVALDPSVERSVTSSLSSALPGLIGTGPHQLSVAQLSSGRARAASGVIGVVGLLLSGLGWISALREALRSLWHQDQSYGNLVVRKLVDIAILIGLGAVLLVSLAVSGIAAGSATTVLGWVGLGHSLVGSAVVALLGAVIPVGVDVALFAFLLVKLPKVSVPIRRILRGALLAAVGFEILKLVGGYYIGRTTSNPVYGTFAVVVGLLVWINLVSRLLLYCAAWVVTGPGAQDLSPSATAPDAPADATPDAASGGKGADGSAATPPASAAVGGGGSPQRDAQAGPYPVDRPAAAATRLPR